MRPFTLPVCLLFALALPAPARQEDSPRMRASRAAIEFMTAEGAASTFVDTHLAAELIERVGAPELVEALETLRSRVAAATLDDLMPDGEHGACLVFGTRSGASSTLLLRIEPAAPHAITDLWLEGQAHLDPAAKVVPLPPPVTWETLEQRMAAEAAAGFSGVLLVARQGNVVLHEGYGLANRELQHACTPETVFAIGSTPIDFTKAGILLLAQDGVLELDQSITAFFEDVPEDKRATTVRHLLTGGSGLQDFHGLPTDRDPDHAWIDRDEAVRRILAQELLFAPGTGEEHSHSAWGLLAAILEIASGTSYQEFTRELLVAPAGMTSTAFNGDPVAPERLAIGYGERSDGATNAPPFWGPASWLVMGSGGMVSTAGDMLRWMQTLRAGAILEPEWLAHYWAPPGALLAGGDMYGFEIVYTEGPQTTIVLISNSVDLQRRRPFGRLARDLARLR